jgi:hypothetical protein
VIRFPRPMLSRLTVPVVALAALCACVTAPTATALVTGQEVTLEGEVVRVDTAPWAYDGNAVVTISTHTAGSVRVQLPARWNLCKAAPIADLQALQPHDRVQVVGTVTAPDALTVCALPQHTLRKLR